MENLAIFGQKEKVKVIRRGILANLRSFADALQVCRRDSNNHRNGIMDLNRETREHSSTPWKPEGKHEFFLRTEHGLGVENPRAF